MAPDGINSAVKWIDFVNYHIFLPYSQYMIIDSESKRLFCRVEGGDARWKCLYVWRGWFTGFELFLDPTTWVNFLPVPLNSTV